MSQGFIRISARPACARPDSWHALSQQFSLLPWVEPQDLGESLSRVAVRAWPKAALEITETTHAEPGHFGELLLGQAGSYAMPPQEFAKRQPSVCRHAEPGATS